MFSCYVSMFLLLLLSVCAPHTYAENTHLVLYYTLDVFISRSFTLMSQFQSFVLTA